MKDTLILFYLRRNNGFFFMLTTIFFISFYFYLFVLKKLTNVPEYAKMQFHRMMLLDVMGKIAWVR